MSTTSSLQPAATAATSPRPDGASHAADRTARLRWVDAVRAASLLVVVLGHYLIAVVVLRDDDVTVSALLDITPWTHPVTWAVQVMACFFAVGAVVAAPRLADDLGSSAGTGSGSTFRSVWRAHVASRARQLVVPVLPLLAVWVLGGPAFAGRFGADLVGVASQAALVPLWFLAVYLLVQALLPMAVRVVQRHGALRPIVLLLAAAGAVDALHLAGVPVVGWLNFPIVWMIPSTLGVAVGLGSLDTVRLWRAGAASLVVALIYLPVMGGVTGRLERWMAQNMTAIAKLRFYLHLLLFPIVAAMIALPLALMQPLFAVISAQFAGMDGLDILGSVIPVFAVVFICIAVLCALVAVAISGVLLGLTSFFALFTRMGRGGRWVTSRLFRKEPTVIKAGYRDQASGGSLPLSRAIR